MAQYGKAEYWEARYSKDPEPFDWYQSYSSSPALRDIIRKSVYVFLLPAWFSPHPFFYRPTQPAQAARRHNPHPGLRILAHDGGDVSRRLCERYRERGPVARDHPGAGGPREGPTQLAVCVRRRARSSVAPN